MVKQVLIVRKDLNMRKGKIAAQCAHASMKVLLDMAVKEDLIAYYENRYNLVIEHIEVGSALQLWLDGNFAKICVYVNSESELDAVYRQAVEAKLLCALIVDAGKTEFHGVPTKTVVAIGPAFDHEVDAITRNLPLL